jgi:hypothetical protein
MRNIFFSLLVIASFIGCSENEIGRYQFYSVDEQSMVFDTKTGDMFTLGGNVNEEGGAFVVIKNLPQGTIKTDTLTWDERLRKMMGE